MAAAARRSWWILVRYFLEHDSHQCPNAHIERRDLGPGKLKVLRPLLKVNCGLPAIEVVE
jgi:hypothetical protein